MIFVCISKATGEKKVGSGSVIQRYRLAEPYQNITDPETLNFSYKNATWLGWLGEQALDLTENVLDGLLRLVHRGALPEDGALPADSPLLLVPQVRAALLPGLAIKNPPKKPTKMFYFCFFLFLIFYEYNTNFSL